MSLKPDYLKELARVVEREVSANRHILESRYTPRKKELAYGDLKIGNSLGIDAFTNISAMHDEILSETSTSRHLFEGIASKPREVLLYSGRGGGKSLFNELYRQHLTKLQPFQKHLLGEFSCTTEAANPCKEGSLDHIRDAFCYLSDTQSNQVKESNKMSMQQTNIRVETLIGLASANNTDEFSKYDQMPEGIKEVLKRKAKEQADAKVEAAAETILSLVNKADAVIQERVEIIRQLRRREKQLKEEITQIEMAKEYGMSSQNFLPLARGLGYHVMQVEERELLNVPSNFKMKAAKK